MKWLIIFLSFFGLGVAHATEWQPVMRCEYERVALDQNEEGDFQLVVHHYPEFFLYWQQKHKNQAPGRYYNDGNTLVIPVRQELIGIPGHQPNREGPLFIEYQPRYDRRLHLRWVFSPSSDYYHTVTWDFNWCHLE